MAEGNGLREFIDGGAVEKELSVNDINLDNAVSTQASRFAHYSYQAALAKQQHKKVKLYVEITEATLYRDKRLKLIAEVGAKAVTENQVQAEMKLDTRWMKMQNMLAQAERIADTIEGVVKAFAQQKDMISIMAHDRRLERSGEIRIREIRDPVEAARAHALEQINGTSNMRGAAGG